MDLILKMPKIKNIYKKPLDFNDFWGSGYAKMDEKSITNRLRFKAQDEVPLGIGF